MLERGSDGHIDCIYTAAMKPIRAKLFQNGGSQAVRLPKAYRFGSQREVLVHREGRRVILEAADEWSQVFRTCLGSVAEDIPRPKQERLSRVRNPFD
jgi:antitoxin VapB